jgi:DNA-binding CsgD family transcriptional regulator
MVSGALFEREAATGAIATALDAVRRGGPSALFVQGEAGLGKTSLIVGARRSAAGLRVGWGEGLASETALPFGLLGQALGPMGALSELETVSDLASGEARASVYYRCERRLRHLCSQAPRVLFLDDLHWADPDSLGLLAFLLRRLNDCPLGLVATMRPWPNEATALAEDLHAKGQAAIERLGPIGDGLAGQVVARAAGRQLSGAELAPVLASCVGNPLLLELAGAGLRVGAPPRPTGPGLSRQLVDRFAGLPAKVLEVAKAASVVGVRFRPSLVAAVAETEAGVVAAALGVLMRAGLARPAAEGQVEFAHPLFAHALYEEISQPERSRMHALAMCALLKAGADPAQAAVHAVSGHLVGDPQAVECLEAAGRTAARAGASDSAVRFLTSAVELASGKASPELLLLLAEAQLGVGLTGSAEATCNRLLDLSSDPTTRADAVLFLARAVDHEDWFAESVSGEASRRWRAAIKAAEGTDRLVATLAEAVSNLSRAEGPARIRTMMDCLRALSQGLPSQERLQVDLEWGAAASLAGDPVGAETVRTALGPRNLRSVMESVAPSSACTMLSHALDTRLFTECFEEADELFAIGWEVAERQGAIATMSMLAVVGAAGSWWRGRLELALELLSIKAAMLSGLKIVPDEELELRAMIATEMGDLNAAISLASRAERGPLLADASADAPWERIQLLRVRGELALDAGRNAEAVRVALQMRELAERTGVRQPLWAPWADVAMEAFLRAKMLDDRRALVDHLEQVSSGWPCRWPRSVAAAGRAGIAEAVGDLAEAERQHFWAVELLEGIDLPLRRARVLIYYGRFLRHSGRAVLARGPLARALEECEACGAMRLASQARAELEASGGRRRRASSVQLSPQELRVAQLAAQGATNAEIASPMFISAKTVEHHLTSVYAKLGVRSRRELKEHFERA